MAKTVFRPNEIKTKSGEVTLKLIHDYSPVEEVEEAPIEEYTGPTPDDLRREAEAFKTGWEIEKKRMLEKAQESADEIVLICIIFLLPKLLCYVSNVANKWNI